VDHRAARPRHPQADGRRRPPPSALSGPQDSGLDQPPLTPGERLVAAASPGAGRLPRPQREDLCTLREALLAPSSPAWPPDGWRRRASASRPASHPSTRPPALRRHHLPPATPHRVRRQDTNRRRAAWTGSRLRTPVPPATRFPLRGVRYKNLAFLRADFRHIKSDDLDLRPVFHRLATRQATFAGSASSPATLTRHLRRAWAPLTFTDENRPRRKPRPPPPSSPPASRPWVPHPHDTRPPPDLSFRGLAGAACHLDPQPVRSPSPSHTVHAPEPTRTSAAF